MTHAIADDLLLAHALARQLVPVLRSVAHETRTDSDPVGDDAADAARLLECAADRLRAALRLCSEQTTKLGRLRAAAVAAAFQAEQPELPAVLAAAVRSKRIPDNAFWAAERLAAHTIQVVASLDDLPDDDLVALCNLYEIHKW